MLVVKQKGAKHHSKRFKGDNGVEAKSDRRILPGKDDVNIKANYFKSAPGFDKLVGSNPYDETIFVLQGLLVLTEEGQATRTLNACDCYVVPAGTRYRLTTPKRTKLFCVCSAVPGGPLPSDD